ncbi:MAG: thioredoxin family protein [Flavipsychrobacter sp.]
MKRVLLLFIALMTVGNVAMAGDKNKKEVKKAPNDKEIEWISFEEAEKRMQKEPRKVWIDVYTDWCGWCKVMDKKTFTHPEVIKYINTKYYAIKFNAERTDSFSFAGKKWGFMPEYKANGLAVQLMNGQMSYPTSIVMVENFQNPSAIPGYLAVGQIEPILKYIGEDIYKTTKFEEYQPTAQSTWKEILMPMAPGHN